jgi:hypothetical protein
MTRSEKKSRIVEIDEIIATLTTERNQLAGAKGTRTVATDMTRKRNVTTLHYNNKVAYGERTEQILAHPDMSAKDLANKLGTHPQYVYKVRALWRDEEIDFDLDLK